MKRLSKVFLCLMLALFQIPSNSVFAEEEKNINLHLSEFTIETGLNRNLYEVEYLETPDRYIANIYSVITNEHVETYSLEKTKTRATDSEGVIRTFTHLKSEINVGGQYIQWETVVKANVYASGSFGQINYLYKPDGIGTRIVTNVSNVVIEEKFVADNPSGGNYPTTEVHISSDVVLMYGRDQHFSFNFSIADLTGNGFGFAYTEGTTQYYRKNSTDSFRIKVGV